MKLMREGYSVITLTQGKVAIVDNDVFDLIGHHKWCLHAGKYAKRRVNNQVIVLHRWITGALPGEVVDHINHDTFDNRRQNLRVCLNCENLRNRKAKRTKDGYKGVHRHTGGKWTAAICYHRKQVHLGLFASEYDAALAYNLAAVQYHGKFAYLNELEKSK